MSAPTLTGVIMVYFDEEMNPRSLYKESEKTIRRYYENVNIMQPVYIEFESKACKIAELIRSLDHADILFCATCGDEKDHIYRFIRAIAKILGKEIVPVEELKKR